jgi:hypothetical protein
MTRKTCGAALLALALLVAGGCSDQCDEEYSYTDSYGSSVECCKECDSNGEQCTTDCSGSGGGGGTEPTPTPTPKEVTDGESA